MKKLLTILAALIISASNVVQAQDCLWAKTIGGNKTDSVYDVCSDVSGNVYIIGYFRSPVVSLGTTIISNFGDISGTSDIFIVKYNPQGTVLWARSIGGPEDDEGRSVYTDASGSVFVTGIFRSSTLTFGTITLTNIGIQNIFMAKYSPEGAVLWAKKAGGNFYDYGNCVTGDESGNVYFTGSFISSTITFEATILTNNSNTQSSDIFIAKYSSDGNLQWAKSAGGTYGDYCKSISADPFGNVFITGYFYSPTITFDNINLSFTSGSDIFITKYSTDGIVLWAKSLEGFLWEISTDVTSDALGNVYLTGSFSSSIITIGTLTLINSGSSTDVFIVKFSPEGVALWAKAAGGSYGLDLGNGLSTDVNGNVYLTGSFESDSINFDTNILTNNSPGYEDIFIVKFAPNGNVIWATSCGGVFGEFGQSVSTDASGSFYVTGCANNFNCGSTNLNSMGGREIFIAKYSPGITGINESLTNNHLIVSPNPSNSSITLTMPALKNSKVSICTLTGTEVGNYNTQNTSTQTIDISHLANGVYFVSLKSEEGLATKKIIKRDY